jgi:hypothetical protein
VSGGGGIITVKDAAGVTHTINANDNGRVNNVMTRDYWLNSDRKTATSIATSSFCAVHEVTEPFYYAKSKRYDAAWADGDITQDSEWTPAGTKKRTADKRTRL